MCSNCNLLFNTLTAYIAHRARETHEPFLKGNEMLEYSFVSKYEPMVLNNCLILPLTTALLCMPAEFDGNAFL